MALRGRNANGGILIRHSWDSIVDCINKLIEIACFGYFIRRYSSSLLNKWSRMLNLLPFAEPGGGRVMAVLGTREKMWWFVNEYEYSPGKCNLDNP